MTLTAPSSSLVSSLLTKTNSSFWTEVLLFFAGVTALSLLAQIVLPLPFTPVPITGQTFGIGLLALCYGFKRGVIVSSTYVLAGSLGLPLFAAGQTGLAWGPTSGYLLGMIVAAGVIGFLADHGGSKGFLRSYLSLAIGSLIIFAFGALGLWLWLPEENVFLLGVLPFLPGDLVKSLTAAALVQGLHKIKDKYVAL